MLEALLPEWDAQWATEAREVGVQVWILTGTGDGEVRAVMRWMSVDRTWVACILGTVGSRSVADAMPTLNVFGTQRCSNSPLQPASLKNGFSIEH